MSTKEVSTHVLNYLQVKILHGVQWMTHDQKVQNLDPFISNPIEISFHPLKNSPISFHTPKL